MDNNTTLQEIRRGFFTAAPLVMGFIPLALILGAQASQVGQSALTATLMTGLNYAGGSEFAAVSLWVQYAPPILMIFISTLLINSRHIVMSAALAPYIRHESGFRVAFIYFLMCDETCSLAMQDIQRRNMEAKPFSYGYYLGVGISLWVMWWFPTMIGAIVGNSMGDMAHLGFTMALPATFIGLTVAMRPRNNNIAYLPIALSFIVSALTAVYGNSNYSVGLGAAAGLIMAYLIQIYKEKHGYVTDEQAQESKVSSEEHSDTKASS